MNDPTLGSWLSDCDYRSGERSHSKEMDLITINEHSQVATPSYNLDHSGQPQPFCFALSSQTVFIDKEFQ